MKISENKIHQNDLDVDDASPVGYFELVCEDQPLTGNVSWWQIHDLLNFFCFVFFSFDMRPHGI